MSNRKERRKILRKMGLLGDIKSKNLKLEETVEYGKNRHRKHLQAVKNDLIKQEKEKFGKEPDSNEVFFYRNESPEYSSLKSFLLNKNWDSFESNESDA